MSTRRHRLVLEVDERAFRALCVLAHSNRAGAYESAAAARLAEGRQRAVETLLELVDRCVDGVYRPGSWERGWLAQAFGPDFESRLEQDPEVEWRQRPRRSP